MKKRWTAALLALCFVLSLAPYALAVGKPLGSAEPSVLYVSESGSNDKDGTSEENATTLDHATEIAKEDLFKLWLLGLSVLIHGQAPR